MNLQDVEHLRIVRSRLMARGADLRERLRRVHADLGRVREPLPRDSKSVASVLKNHEVLRAIETSATAEIHHIEHALERVETGGFGVCERCSGAVTAARLEIVPYATRCGACERTS